MSDDGLNVRGPGEGAEPEVPLKLRAIGWARDLALTVVGVGVLWAGLGWLRAPTLPDTAPALALQNLEGETVDLASLRGGPVVVNFWATWCAPCVVEMPILTSFAENNPEVPVLFVAVDGSEDKLRTFAAEHGLDAKQVLRLDAATKRNWPVSTLPTTVVVDAAGTLRAAHAGVVTPPQLWWWTR